MGDIESVLFSNVQLTNKAAAPYKLTPELKTCVPILQTHPVLRIIESSVYWQYPHSNRQWALRRSDAEFSLPGAKFHVGAVEFSNVDIEQVKLL